MRNGLLALVVALGFGYLLVHLVRMAESETRKAAPPPITATVNEAEVDPRKPEPVAEVVASAEPDTGATKVGEAEPQSTATRAPLKPVPWITVDRSQSMQRERRELLTKLDGLKVIKAPSKPRPDTVHVVVRDAFMALSFEEKERFMSVLYVYAFDATSMNDRVLLFDYQTGKEVGRYSLAVPGLEMY